MFYWTCAKFPAQGVKMNMDIEMQDSIEIEDRESNENGGWGNPMNLLWRSVSMLRTRYRINNTVRSLGQSVRFGSIFTVVSQQCNSLSLSLFPLRE